MQYDPLSVNEETYLEDIDGTPDKRNRLTDETLKAALSTLPLREVVCLSAASPVAEAIRLMQDNGIGCVLVTDDDDKLTGIFTERDVLMRIAGHGPETLSAPLRDLMTPNPEALRIDHPMGYALNLMSEGGYRHIPVVDEDGAPVRVVSVRDIVAYIADHFPEEVKNLPPDPDQTAGSRHGG